MVPDSSVHSVWSQTLHTGWLNIDWVSPPINTSQLLIKYIRDRGGKTMLRFISCRWWDFRGWNNYSTLFLCERKSMGDLCRSCKEDILICRIANTAGVFVVVVVKVRLAEGWDLNGSVRFQKIDIVKHTYRNAGISLAPYTVQRMTTYIWSTPIMRYFLSLPPLQLTCTLGLLSYLPLLTKRQLGADWAKHSRHIEAGHF